MSCGVGRRLNLGVVLLWHCCRLAAAAPIQPLTWELPYAAGVALKSKNRLSLCGRHYSKYFEGVISFNPHRNPMRKNTVTPLFFTDEDSWVSESLNNFPRVTQWLLEAALEHRPSEHSARVHIRNRSDIFPKLSSRPGSRPVGVGNSSSLGSGNQHGFLA